MSKKILIATDVVSLRFFIMMHLREFDILFFEAGNSQETISLAEEKNPDLIIIDYLIPELTDFETIRRIQSNSRTRDILIILLTAEKIDLQVSKLKISGYITKPFTPKQLIETISKVWGTLPRKAEEITASQGISVPQIPQAKIEVPSREQRIKKVLIADDEPETIALIKIILGNGYQFIEAKNGKELAEKAEEEPPDLIISDVVMPFLSGWRAVEKIRKIPNLRNTPIVFNSGLLKDRELFDVLKPEGPCCFILKPFKKKELLENIEALLKK